MRYAYKCVAAPRRTKRRKGQKTPGEALAAAFEDALSEQAAAGWEYIRTDLVPCEARHGLFGGLRETHQAVMIFRRALSPAAAHAAEEREAPVPNGAAEPEAEPPAAPPLGAARID